MASNDKYLVGFEQPRDGSDRLHKVLESSDQRGSFHAAVRGVSVNFGVARASRLAARQIRRRNVVLPKSIPSASTKGDERRNRIILSPRLTNR